MCDHSKEAVNVAAGIPHRRSLDKVHDLIYVVERIVQVGHEVVRLKKEITTRP